MFMKEFNETVVMDSRVYYQSLYTTMNSSFDDLMFRSTYPYIIGIRGENDGLISAYSAQWGDNCAKIGSGISHMDIIDYNVRKVSGKDIPGIYIGIVKALSEKGF
jgi:triacylglycerol esterase/lipase EstA (alpha/beta hydrolase family)